MTEEMKKFNTFKFICIDNDPIQQQEIIELKEVDGYLVGNLFHLSNYALVAKNVDTETPAEATTQTNQGTGTTTEEKINNPKTGDNIMLFVVMFAISIVGLGVIKYKKECTKMQKSNIINGLAEKLAHLL